MLTHLHCLGSHLKQSCEGRNHSLVAVRNDPFVVSFTCNTCEHWCLGVLIQMAYRFLHVLITESLDHLSLTLWMLVNPHFEHHTPSNITACHTQNSNICQQTWAEVTQILSLQNKNRNIVFICEFLKYNNTFYYVSIT